MKQRNYHPIIAHTLHFICQFVLRGKVKCPVQGNECVIQQKFWFRLRRRYEF